MSFFSFRTVAGAVIAIQAGLTSAADTPDARTTQTSAATRTAGTAEPDITELPAMTVQGNYDNAVGTSDAASQGVVNAKLIQSRPVLRPAEVLEFVPGVIITQHSGDGKANQYFLRGFNLDHGTDFATFVDGMPVNMPSHAHGQGYSDLNWLIPELVERIGYRKGPYYAEEGDFASAGAARIGLVDRLPRGMASLTGGSWGYGRSLIADSHAVGNGDLLYAFEASHNDGPWDKPENFRKLNGVLRYSFGDDDNLSHITAMGYSAKWNSTDQIPKRAVKEGLIGRFGSLDSSDHGRTERYSLSFDTRRKLDDGLFRFNAYAIHSRLDLFSDFTYLLDNPADLGGAANPSGLAGDQFEQAEKRNVFGFASSRAWFGELAGLDMSNTLGVQLRHDRLDPVGLYSAANGKRVDTTQKSQVRETAAALYGENSLQWTSWLRSVAGLRLDHYNFDVNSNLPQNSGKRSAIIGSPKLSLIFGPWARTEYFLNYGYGFHSNDARGVTARVTPKELQATNPADPLVRTKGGEIGIRTEIVPRLQSSIAFWQLKVDSELVFSGDAGDTEPSRPSLRRGIEWNNHYMALPWLFFDLDLATSHARYTRSDPSGQHIPGAIEKVASFGVSVTDLGPWFGQFQLRYFGPRPLIEDNSVRSKATTLAYLRVGYKFNPDWKLALDVFNLFDSKADDITYYYASRLAGESAGGTEDVHFHPVEPRNFRATLTTYF